MSINDPQWGNSHRPEQKDPEQAPDNTGAEPVQPDAGGQGAESQSKPPVEPPVGEPKKPAGPPEGPPDLEVLWQQLVHSARCKLAALLRREPPPPPATIKTAPVVTQEVADEPLNWQALSVKSWLMGVALLLGAWLMSGFYLVDANQRGVLSRFGVIASTEDPGWHWRWPYPLESVRLVNVTSDRTLEVGVPASANRQAPVLMLTADQNLAGLGYAVVYQVVDPVAYLSRIETPSDLLGLVAETALRQEVAQQPLSVLQGLLNKPGTENASSPVLEDVRQQAQQKLDTLKAGIQIKSIQIKDIALPGPVVQAIKQADQEAQAQIKALREAQSAAGESVIKARKLANQLQAETAGYTQELDVAVMRINTANPKPESDAALNQLAEANVRLRQQYPLVFDSYADLVAKTQAGSQKKSKAAPSGGDASAPKTTDWRDRELMRNRDRVDRPGSGS